MIPRIPLYLFPSSKDPKSPPLSVLEFVFDLSDEVDSLSDRFLATLRDGESSSSVVPSPPRRACTSLSTALASWSQCLLLDHCSHMGIEDIVLLLNQFCGSILIRQHT